MTTEQKLDKLEAQMHRLLNTIHGRSISTAEYNAIMNAPIPKAPSATDVKSSDIPK